MSPHTHPMQICHNFTTKAFAVRYYNFLKSRVMSPNINIVVGRIMRIHTYSILNLSPETNLVHYTYGYMDTWYLSKVSHS